jgi:hypothetical protein
MKAVSGQQHGKDVPPVTNTHTTIEERCFLCGPCREVIARTLEAMSEFTSARQSEKIWRSSSVVGYSPDSNDVSTEAEESPLFRTVTKQRVVKALQAGQDSV